MERILVDAIDVAGDPRPAAACCAGLLCGIASEVTTALHAVCRKLH